ncbi:hypothetical protein PO79_03560, partial [Vibrio parahaemolyticus]
LLIGRLFKYLSPLKTKKPEIPAKNPIIKRIAVPEFPQSKIQFGDKIGILERVALVFKNVLLFIISSLYCFVLLRYKKSPKLFLCQTITYG